MVFNAELLMCDLFSSVQNSHGFLVGHNCVLVPPLRNFSDIWEGSWLTLKKHESAIDS